MDLKKFFDSILDIFSSPKKLLISIIMLFVILSLVIYFFPIINDFFIMSRLQKRIDILDKITKLNHEYINNNEKLKNEYDNIIIDLGKSRTFDISSIKIITYSSDTKIVKIMKFITGSFIWILFILISIFSKANDTLRKKITAVIIFLIGAIICGFIGIKIPTIKNEMINYIFYPVLQFILIFLIYFSFQKKK